MDAGGAPPPIPSPLPRYLLPRALEALADTPVVYLVGSRQCGKTTLARQLPEHGHPARYLTFDDLDVLAAARADPVGFVAGFEGAVVVDEVQRVPEVALAIKASVDRDRRPGRFFLTGSADVLALPQIAEALVGRMEVLTLRPLAQCELDRRGGDWVDRLFAGGPLGEPAAMEPPPGKLWERILAGGFPEAIQRVRLERRDAWFDAYVTTLLVREVSELVAIDRLDTLPRLLRILATRSASLLNVSELSRVTELPLTSLRRYLTLLETAFAVTLLPPWSAGGRGKRLVKAPKLHVADSGLLAHLLGAGPVPATTLGHLRGPLFEGFVVQEVAKLASWSRVRPRLYHFRSHAREEVDLVLEDSAGRIVGIEAQAGATTTSSDFSGLRALRQLAGDRWIRGLVVHGGARTVPFEADLHAVPASEL